MLFTWAALDAYLPYRCTVIGNNRLNATFKATQRIRRGGNRVPFETDALLDVQSDLLPPRKMPASPVANAGVSAEDGEDPDAVEGSSSHDSFKQHVHVSC